MAKPVFLIFLLLALTFGGECQEEISRKKRFLDPYNFWPESYQRQERKLKKPGLPMYTTYHRISILKFGQEAKEFGEQLSSHAQRTLDDLFTEGIRLRDKFHQVSPINRWKSDVEAPQKQLQSSQIEKEDFDPAVDVAEVPEPSPAEVPQTSLLPNPFFQRPVLQTPFFGFGLFTPWWKGPNICVERSDVEESEDNASNFTGLSFSFESTQCVPTETTYICSKRSHTNGVKRTTVVRHQCCHGFTRRTDGRPGCTQLQMDNLIDTMNNLGATRFAHAIESFNLKDRILSGNFTIFCPTNEAMIDFEDETEENEIILERRIERRSASDKSSVISGHIAEGFYNYDTMDNEQTIHSINEKPIRINKYNGPSSVFTANCVPVTTKNHFATNGIVHFVPEVLQFPTKTVADIISSDPQFSILKELLSKSGLDESLNDLEKSWTVFAPTDDAFKEMDPSLLQEMREGKRCVKSTIKQHIVQSTMCSAAVSERMHLQNLLENRLVLIKNEDENIKVDGKEILEKNILGTNGVIHTIDGVMVPPQAKNIVESLEEAGRTDLLDLIETANLIPTFRKFENVTFFAPCKDAVQDISNSTLNEWQDNPDKLRDILLYHVVAPKTSAFAFQNNQQLTSLLDDKTIHIKLHEIFPGIITGATAQCARVVNSDNEACGAYIHVINKVLAPPKESIFVALQSMDGHDTFRKLVKSSGLEDKLKESGSLTLLVPTDEAFEHLREGELDEILENSTKAEEIVKRHILPEMLCCTSASLISPFHQQYVRTEDGSLLSLHRNLHNRVRFGRARVIKCDIMAENGIIHTINRVLLPPKHVAFDFGFLSLF